MTIFVTSDQHFCNYNIWAKYEVETRPFNSQEEHDNTLIKKWNSVVQPCDTVYQLGDFIMGKAENIEKILPQLNGNIVLVRGNHDTDNKVKIYQEYGIEMRDIVYLNYQSEFDGKNYQFVMCHYPIENQKMFQQGFKTKKPVDSILLYGHIHGNAVPGYTDGSFHVGVDTNNLTPVRLDDIVRQKVFYDTWGYTNSQEYWLLSHQIGDIAANFLML